MRVSSFYAGGCVLQNGIREPKKVNCAPKGSAVFMYSYYLQNKQQHNAGDAENARYGGIEPCHGDVQPHPCAEEVENKQKYEAEEGVKKNLHGQLHGAFQYFEKQADEGNAHGQSENNYCDCHFTLSPSMDLMLRSAAL